MEELDFSKIFGETATSKASFTDENYINGWGYLGSTPPPYQLFDYLQGLNDKKSKYLYDWLNKNKNNLLAHNTDPSAHEDILNAHNADVNAHNPILNAIKAISGMSSYDISPSKTIASIIPLLGLGGIVAQKLDTNGYVKFANGFTIQWGVVSIPDGKYYSDFTLPIACNLFAVFVSDTVGGISTSQVGNTSLCWNTGGSSNTQIRILAGTNGMGSVNYIAVGTSV